MTTMQMTDSKLGELVGSVREAVTRELDHASTAAAAAEVLERFLAMPDLIPDHCRVGDPERYRQHIIHSEPDGSFSVVVLVWMPGQATTIHDHLSWCVAGVYEGAESETRYELRGQGEDTRLVPTLEVDNPAGVAVGFAPPGDIHMVRNAQDGPVIAVHIYGANIDRLGTSVRRTYDHLPIASA